MTKLHSRHGLASMPAPRRTPSVASHRPGDMGRSAVAQADGARRGPVTDELEATGRGAISFALVWLVTPIAACAGLVCLNPLLGLSAFACYGLFVAFVTGRDRQLADVPSSEDTANQTSALGKHFDGVA